MLHVAYLARVIYFLTQNLTHILLRESFACVLHRHFHVFLRILRIEFHLSTLRSIFSRILQQRVHHEKCQCLIRLYHGIGQTYLQIQVLVFEHIHPFTQQFEQFSKFETLNVERHGTLAYLNPMCQHVVIQIDSVCQFRHVAQSLPRQVPNLFVLIRVDFLDFVHCPVQERSDGINNRQTRHLVDILLFLFLDTMLKAETLLLNVLLNVLERGEILVRLRPPTRHLLFHRLHFSRIILLILAPHSPTQSQHQSNECHAQHPHNQHHAVQLSFFLLQRFQMLLHALVLTRRIQDVEIDISIIVRLLFHPQRTIHDAQMLPHIRHPFREAHLPLQYPFHLMRMHHTVVHQHIHGSTLRRKKIHPKPPPVLPEGRRIPTG